MYKVFITTAGIGSRLGSLTENSNKSLLTIENKRIIDYIFDSYDPSIPLVISLGFYGNVIKKYLEETYANRHMTFVFVEPFIGPGSSLGYSMLAAKDYLQCPFIFHCNDTIVLDKIPTPETGNWDGIALASNSEIFTTNQFSSVLIKDNQLIAIQAKGTTQNDGLHIGLVGIKDHEVFWSVLENLYQQHPEDETLNDCSAIQVMIENNIQFIPHMFSHWFDTGNQTSFTYTKQQLKSLIK